MPFLAIPAVIASIGAASGVAGAVINAKKAGGSGNSNLIDIPPPAADNPELFNQYKSIVGKLGPQAFSVLGDFMKNGMPTDVGPAYEAMLAANDRSSAMGRENILTQFGAMGLRGSSPLMNALGSYEVDLRKQFADVLAQFTLNAQEAARNRQLAAANMGIEAFGAPALAMHPTAVVKGSSPSATGQGLSALGGGLLSLALLLSNKKG